MGKLLEFLVKNPVDNLTEEVVLSARLSAYPFTIKAMTGQDFNDYQKVATIIGKKHNTSFNATKFNELVVLNHTVEPNFKDAESIKLAGCNSPEQFLYKSLLAGEIAELSNKISVLSGFDTDLDEEIENAKNS